MLGALASLVASLIAVAATALVAYSTYIWYLRRRINLPTPEYKDFFLGHGAELRKFAVNTFPDWAAKYGLVYQVHVYHYTFILAADYRWVKEFCTSSRYTKPKFVYEKLLGNLFGIRVLGYGLVTNGTPSDWLKHRMMLNPAFHKNALAELHSTFNDNGNRLLVRLNAAVKSGENVNIWDIFGRVAIDIVAKTAFGMNTDMLNEPSFNLRHCIYMYFKGENMLFNDPYFTLRPSKYGFIQEVKKCCRTLRKIGHDCISERFDLLIKDPSSVPNDALTLLLRGSLTKDQQLTPEELEWIIDEFVTLFIAGHETTALLLTATLYELSRHPLVLQKALAEVDAVTKGSEDITIENVGNLKYLETVLKESLRLYPPAPGTVREVAENTTVFGVNIPAKTHICMNFLITHTWPEYYENPLEFIPERFESEESRLPASYLPFSLGPRICLGKDFALIEAKILMAKILQNYNFVVLPEPKFELEFIATLRLKQPILLNFSRRSP